MTEWQAVDRVEAMTTAELSALEDFLIAECSRAENVARIASADAARAKEANHFRDALALVISEQFHRGLRP